MEAVWEKAEFFKIEHIVDADELTVVFADNTSVNISTTCREFRQKLGRGVRVWRDIHGQIEGLIVPGLSSNLNISAFEIRYLSHPEFAEFIREEAFKNRRFIGRILADLRTERGLHQGEFVLRAKVCCPEMRDLEGGNEVAYDRAYRGRESGVGKLLALFQSMGVTYTIVLYRIFTDPKQYAGQIANLLKILDIGRD